MSSFTEEGEFEEIDIRNLTPDIIEKLQLTDEEIAQIELSRSKFFKRLVKPAKVVIAPSGHAKIVPISGVSIPNISIPGVSNPGNSNIAIFPSGHGGGKDLVLNGSDDLDDDNLNRDYTIIVDKSDSMAGKRWREAQEAVKLIAPRVCEFDSDGISLYFFSTHFSKFENVKTAEDVIRIFKANEPDGSTNLSEVLQDAIKPDNFIRSKSGKHIKRKPETILVITDGEPDNQKSVEEVIVDAAFSLDDDSELSITLIQVGDDVDASTWLKKLDDHLTSGPNGAKFDIVDTLSIQDLKSIHFHDLIRKSIYD